MKRIFTWLIVMLILADIAWFTYELTNLESLSWTFYIAIALFFTLVLALARASARD